MSNDTNTKSIKVSTEKRTYFFDVRQTIEGAKYLRISESKHLESGDFQRHQVKFFEEDISKITDAFHEVLQHFPAFIKPSQKSNNEPCRGNNANAYKPWTEEDDATLKDLFRTGKSNVEISEILQRNTGAIRSRINKLELKTYN